MSSLSSQLTALFPLFQVQETVLTQAANEPLVQLVKTNPLRWLLWATAYTASGTNSSLWGTNPANVAAGNGQILPLSNSANISFAALALSYRQHGPLVQSAIYGGYFPGVAPMGNTIWTTIELLLTSE